MSIEFIEDLKRQWMAMIDAINDPLVILDSDFNILRQNTAYARTAIKTEELSIREFKEKKCFEVFVGRTSPCVHCKIKEAIAKREAITWFTKDLIAGKDYEIRAHVLLDNSTNNNAERVVVHYRDISEQILLQETLAQSDKLAALGKLAGGVAHEINSPLAGILAFAQIVLKEMDENDPHLSDIKEIEDAAKKCKTIVEGLLGFARQGKASDVGEINVFDLVRSTLRLVSPIIRKHELSMEVNLPEEAGIMLANPGKIGQIFLNLITNAVQSMAGIGGLLSVQGQLTNTHVVVHIRDQGTGIEPCHLSRIFDPFFTTKPIGEGTGLGLSISYSIAKQYAGEIKVNSSPGIGSEFSVFLPRLK